MTPETHYTLAGGVSIAYQVIGEGPIDLVMVPGWVSNIEIFWEEPGMARFLRGLASFSRLILFDKRGTGLSDRVTDTPTLEERMADVRAVMEAVGSQRAAMVGYSEGGPMSALFAATYPQKTIGLVMIGSYARRTCTRDYPWGPTPEENKEFIDGLEASWPSDTLLYARAPSMVGDDAFTHWWLRYLRLSASPHAVQAMTRANAQIDIRHILPSITVPSLVIHAKGDKTLEIGHGRYMAEQIPGAKFLEIDSTDHLPWLHGSETILHSIQEFLTGNRPQHACNRVLSTILFTDIVGSTRLAAEQGDRGWSDLEAAHEHITRQELASYNGKEINTTGDGFVLAFEGPASAVHCAQAIRDALADIGIGVYAGIHSGECEIADGRYIGMALNIASRILSLAPPGEILVSRTVKDLVAGSGLTFEDYGTHTLKNIEDDWHLYRVV